MVGDWGGEDFADLMAMLDAVIAAADPPIDPARLAIAGGSYGGFMSCWAITQTDRFAVALAGASITNLETEYGTADIGPSWLRDEQGGSPAEREQAYATARRSGSWTASARPFCSITAKRTCAVRSSRASSSSPR